jgi:ribosomal-protein-alanine N-acetyltransferase
MQLSDIDAVMVLENISFAEPWPRSLYEREVTQGRFSRYHVIAPAAAETGLPPLLGQGGYWLMGEEAHIVTIAVDPAWRGHKLGKWLLLTLLAEARRRGAEIVTLEVRPSNTTALALYRKIGFVQIGQRRRYYPDGEDAHVLELTNLHEERIWEPLQRELVQLNKRMAVGIAI